MKRILVAGGAGFLGSNLCKKLVECGDYVICFDNLYTGRRKNIRCLLKEKNFEFIEGDVTKKEDLFKIKDIDQIYNAACPASPYAYQKSPTYTTKVCVIGIINLLELALKNDATILQFSTSEVYGDPCVHPQIETYKGNVNPIGVRSCYDEGKRVAESLMFDYNREFNAKIKIIRIFNTYGINMDINDGRVVSNFIVEALLNKNITIFGDGKQTRSFCYVSDLIDGIICMMNSDTNFYGPVNLGNPGEFTMLELAEKVIKLTNSKSKIIYRELPGDDPAKRKPDISLAKEKLNWEPVIDLDEGLKISIEYFKNELVDRKI